MTDHHTVAVAVVLVVVVDDEDAAATATATAAAAAVVLFVAHGAAAAAACDGVIGNRSIATSCCSRYQLTALIKRVREREGERID